MQNPGGGYAWPAAGQRSAIAQWPQSGFRALHTARPW